MSKSNQQRNANTALHDCGSKDGFHYGSVHSKTFNNPDNNNNNNKDALWLDYDGEDKSQQRGDTVSLRQQHHDGASGRFNDKVNRDANSSWAASLRSLSHHSGVGSIRVSLSRSWREFVDEGLVPDGSRNVSVRSFGGGATVASEVVNVAKNLIGGY